MNDHSLSLVRRWAVAVLRSQPAPETLKGALSEVKSTLRNNSQAPLAEKLEKGEVLDVAEAIAHDPYVLNNLPVRSRLDLQSAAVLLEQTIGVTAPVEFAVLSGAEGRLDFLQARLDAAFPRGFGRVLLFSSVDLFPNFTRGHECIRFPERHAILRFGALTVTQLLPWTQYDGDLAHLEGFVDLLLLPNTRSGSEPAVTKISPSCILQESGNDYVVRYDPKNQQMAAHSLAGDLIQTSVIDKTQRIAQTLERYRPLVQEELTIRIRAQIKNAILKSSADIRATAALNAAILLLAKHIAFCESNPHLSVQEKGASYRRLLTSVESKDTTQAIKVLSERLGLDMGETGKRRDSI